MNEILHGIAKGCFTPLMGFEDVFGDTGRG